MVPKRSMEPAPQQDLRDRMLADHRELDQMLDGLVAACEARDRRLGEERWREFSVRLLAHVDAEDRWLLPALFRSAPRGARAIAEEHKHIRARVKEIAESLAVDLVRVDVMRSFAEELRAHGRTEERHFYQWADAHCAEVDKLAIVRRLDQMSPPVR